MARCRDTKRFLVEEQCSNGRLHSMTLPLPDVVMLEQCAGDEVTCVRIRGINCAAQMALVTALVLILK